MRNEFIVILGLTANADSETSAACLKAGMNDVLAKPIRRIVLHKALAKRLYLSD